MKQYIYGNIEKKGYIYLSSDSKFFLDPHKAQAMPHLVCYDTTCRHGDLAPEEHQCYWMLTTDLNIPGEESRLFLQASGFHPDRGAIYAHGFISEDTDTDLYGPKLLERMRTRFCSGVEIAELKTTDFPRACAEAPVDTSLSPAPLPVLTLERLLQTLLLGRKLILRLPQTGRAAMRSSREILLNIYSRLPYLLRRSNGFVTGMSSHKILDTTNTLPAAITICLMDRDADASGLPPLGTEYFTLSETGELSEASGRTLPPIQSKLATFLASEDPEKLDGFFRFCQQLIRMASEGFQPGIGNYELFLLFYTLGSQTEQDITDEQISLCAANLYGIDGKLKNLKAELYRRVEKVLSPQRLAQYLCGKITDFEDLYRLGIPDPQEQKTILSGTVNKVSDTNAALTMRLAQNYYTSPDDIRTLLRPLAVRFSELACLKYPALVEPDPKAETIRTLEAMQLEDTPGGSIKERLINLVHNALRKRRAAVVSKYEDNRRIQLEQGIQAIRSWPLHYTPDSLEGLYAQLESDYSLCDELMFSWNPLIGQKLVEACGAVVLQNTAQCGGLLENTQTILDRFQEKGGTLSDAQNAQLAKQTNLWRNIRDLSQRPCSSIRDLLGLFAEADALWMPPEVKEEIKRSFAAKIPQPLCTDREITDCTGRIAAKDADRLERELLLPVLVQNLHSIPADLPLGSIKIRLNAAEQLRNAALFQQDIDFRPWNCKRSPLELRETLTLLETYSPERPEPPLDNPALRRWAAEQLPGNLKLMYLLAERDPGLGSKVLDVLAQKAAMDSGKVETLYFSGWSREALCAAGAGQESAAWRNALEKVFPNWVSLPEPAFPKPSCSAEKVSGLFLIPALVGLAGLFPTVIPGVLGERSPSMALWSAAALSLAAASCFGLAFLNLQPAQKTLLRRLALALLPGILAAAVLGALMLASVL